jgi:hypothetical protein
VPVLVEEIDASDWSEAELKERLVQRAHRPFDLERGPILGVTLFRRSAEHHVLLVAVHHIAIDFWSFVVLMQDLNLLYPAEVTGAPAILPPVPMDYTDYVAWQAEMMAGPEGERHWAYWRQQLAGELPVLDLPTDRPRPAAQTYAGASYAFRLDTALTGRLKALAKAEGVTVYMTVLAAFLILLHRYTEQDDILIGAPLAARTRAEFEPIVGCVTNPVVLRADLSGNPTFKAFLGQVRIRIFPRCLWSNGSGRPATRVARVFTRSCSTWCGPTSSRPTSSPSSRSGIRDFGRTWEGSTSNPSTWSIASPSSIWR